MFNQVHICNISATSILFVGVWMLPYRCKSTQTLPTLLKRNYLKGFRKCCSLFKYGSLQKKDIMAADTNSSPACCGKIRRRVMDRTLWDEYLFIIVRMLLFTVWRSGVCACVDKRAPAHVLYVYVQSCPVCAVAPARCSSHRETFAFRHSNLCGTVLYVHTVNKQNCSDCYKKTRLSDISSCAVNRAS